MPDDTTWDDEDDEMESWEALARSSLEERIKFASSRKGYIPGDDPADTVWYGV